MSSCDLCGNRGRLAELRWWDRNTPRLCPTCLRDCTPPVGITADARREMDEAIDMERQGNMPGDPLGDGGY